MVQDNNAPANAGATPEELKAQTTADAKTTAKAEVKEGADTKKESKIVFKSEDGSKYELLVKEFTFKGKKYASKEAVKENTDVLEALVEAKSFILKKV